MVSDKPIRLKGRPQTKGYLQIELFWDDKSSSEKLIHVLVMEAFIGPYPVDEHNRRFQIHHIDGNQKNNALLNLAYLSADDHAQITRSSGRFLLTPEAVWTARCKLITQPFGEVAGELIQTHSIGKSAASCALRGRSWSSVPSPSEAVSVVELARALGVSIVRAAELLDLARPWTGCQAA